MEDESLLSVGKAVERHPSPALDIADKIDGQNRGTVGSLNCDAAGSDSILHQRFCDFCFSQALQMEMLRLAPKAPWIT